jgi:DNA-directed RNA polymerase specialized sigma24 family protein
MDELGDPARDEQIAALERAKAAAAAGDATGMVEALYQSALLDGLVQNLDLRWEALQREDAEDAVSEAVSSAFEAVRDGERVGGLAQYLWRIADRGMMARIAARRRERALTAEDLALERHAGDVGRLDAIEPGRQVDAISPEERRSLAIRLARQLAPRLNQVNEERTVAVLIDAVEAEIPELTSTELGKLTGLKPDTAYRAVVRGLRKLSRIAAEEGLHGDFDVIARQTVVES